MQLKLLSIALTTLLLVGQADGQLVVAHRGASAIAPENTLAAFRLAWEHNADAIEGDFHLTADKKIVCLHDKTTARTATDQPPLTVAKASLAELKKLDVGLWKSKDYADEAIPTLAEVLAIVPEGKKIFVEIKCGIEIIPHLAQTLSQSQLKTEQVVIICFDKAVVRSVRQSLPKFKCNWLTSYKNENEKKQWRPTKRQVNDVLTKIAPTGIGSQFNRNVVDQEFVETIQSSGLEFHVWTVDDPVQIKDAFAMKVESITTNRPDVACKIRKESASQAEDTPVLSLEK